MEENYHSVIEGRGIKWLKSLIEQDTDFYLKINENGENLDFCHDERYNFLLFISVQYFRSKASKERWVNTIRQLACFPWDDLNLSKENIRLENLTHHISWDLSHRVASYLRLKNSPLTLLKNETNIPFITSDQPVINLFADYRMLGKVVNGLALYYPISPNIAIIINGEDLRGTINLDEQQVDIYNKKIIDSSYQYIFANNADVIKRYIDI